jgi:NADH-quinone oxidoreductase subunit D
VHVVSDGGTRPFRIHRREPSFINLRASATLAIGGIIASVASIDPVMNGVDR